MQIVFFLVLVNHLEDKSCPGKILVGYATLTQTETFFLADSVHGM